MLACTSSVSVSSSSSVVARVLFRMGSCETNAELGPSVNGTVFDCMEMAFIEKEVVYDSALIELDESCRNTMGRGGFKSPVENKLRCGI